jgi:hypothetical protein
VLAEQAVAADPGKSNRAIADDIGVDETTVRRARNRGAAKAAPDKRTGRDGKRYPPNASRSGSGASEGTKR